MLPPSRAVARKLWLRRAEKRAVRYANRARGPVMVVDSEIVEPAARPSSASSSAEKPHPVIEGRIVEG
jgi:UPF0716 protein FxsA